MVKGSSLVIGSVTCTGSASAGVVQSVTFEFKDVPLLNNLKRKYT